MSNWLTVIEFDFLAEWLKASAREQHQVLEKIKILAQDPLPDGYTKRLLKYQANKVYRMRSGRYRIIYSLEHPYISILSLELKDDDTYNTPFSPHPLNNIDNFIEQLQNIKLLDIDQLEEAFLLALKAEVKQLVSQIPKNSLEVEKEKLAEEKDKLEEATSVLALLEDELYQRRQQLNQEKEKIEAEKQVILAEAHTFVKRKLSEAQQHVTAVQPPPSASIWISQKPDDAVLSLPPAEQFRLRIENRPTREPFIYLFLLGLGLLLIPLNAVLQLGIFLAGSALLAKRFFRETQRSKNRLDYAIQELDKRCNKYEATRKKILSTYHEQRRISEAG
jgi:mRNA-degrading endonuclease RelE of RelBE toxin-antitoxin system